MVKRLGFERKILVQELVAVLRILLDMPPDAAPDAPEYLRLLGMRETARPLLHAIQRQAALPVITKPARSGEALAMDGRAELLWGLGAGRMISLYEQSPVILQAVD